ncbi:uncharacterized protein C8Q71DRAFT_316422 [Rhodofomes roseus]|uniref:F-box domain-containing protein n=1 Tax=Rhodofomes roseus TaxID=34475 RepID=A0ABQ8K2I0_9APHY|nr:uncharacterized protein C8Q71DRAFT_316422 [Rhodofomes roseus]KAH9830975.1 hypothetical protein C8Q71DRAFT_316422 [Rhodofomes roseus]
MSIYGVPVEIGEVIVSYLVARRDVLQFAFTCKEAYACALPSILRDVSLSHRTKIEASEQLQAFCNYVLAHLSQRAPCIRSLTIGAPVFKGLQVYFKPDFALTSDVARILALATGLRVLTVRGAERLFSNAPSQVVAAITSLKNLAEIRFEDYAGPHALRILSEMASRPAVVRLSSFDAPNCRLVPGRHHLLYNLTQSLVTLTLVNNLDLIQVLEPGVVWPAVRHLTLGGVRDVASLPALARAFPEVRKLEVYARCIDEKIGRDLWTRLESVSLDRPVPICRPVRNVELVGSDWVQEQLCLAVEMMMSMAPTSLTCRDADYWAVAQLVKCAARTVRFVKFVHAKNTQSEGAYKLGGPCSVEGWLDSHYFNTLGQAPLNALVVPVDTVYLDALGDQSAMHSSARKAVVILDIACGIAARIPTVVHIGLDLGHHPSGGQRWYKVVSRDAHHLRLEALREREGREV